MPQIVHRWEEISHRDLEHKNLPKNYQVINSKLKLLMEKKSAEGGTNLAFCYNMFSKLIFAFVLILIVCLIGFLIIQISANCDQIHSYDNRFRSLITIPPSSTSGSIIPRLTRSSYPAMTYL